MSNRICYSPEKGIDDVIASKLGGGYSKYRIATLRGMYDTANPNNPLDTSNPDTAAIKLVNFSRQQYAKRAKEITSTFTHLGDSYKKLKSDFSAEERFNRVNMIAYMFSQRLTAYANGVPGVTRTQIANGYVDANNIVRGGELNIFEAVYYDLVTAYERYTANNNIEAANKIEKVLDNWAPLVTFARIKLRDTEGLVLGANSSYSTEVDPSNYMDEDLSQIFDLNESTREGWQEVAAAISSFGSLGKDVRNFLSNIPVVDDKGNQLRDDLGIPKTLDPVKAHQSLLEIVRGCSSKETMMSRLRSRAATAVWLRPIINSLEDPSLTMSQEGWNSLTDDQKQQYRNNIDQLKTKLFVDLKKNFQPYSTIKRVFENGVLKFKTAIINKTNEDTALSKYVNRAVFGQPLTEDAVYGEGGKISWEKVQTLRDLFNKYLTSPEKNAVEGHFFWRTSKADKLTFLMKSARLLDIPMTTSSAEQLLHSRRDLNRYLNALTDFNYKILNVLMKNKTDLGNVEYKDFISRPVGYGNNQVTLKDRIKVLSAIGIKYTEGSRLERACRFTGSRKRGTTYYSDVNPSYLGDEIDTIQEFVEAGDSRGLKEYIRNKYLVSPYFMSDGKILNWWLRDLYEEGVEDGSFAANFTPPDRLLGEDGNEFENFTSKAHTEALFTKYFAQRQLHRNVKEDVWRKDYADYPVFILGDSGVAKFIKAKRYDAYTSTDKLLDGFYDVYKQERRRMEIVEAVAKKMNPGAVREDNTLDWSKVTVKIENFTDSKGRYSLLPFLNKDYKNSKGRVESKYANMLSENPTEGEVKDAIKAYMEDSIKDFIDRLVEYGVVTVGQTKEGKTVYSSPVLTQEMATGLTFEQIIQDYFWNTKFATIQQLQMFTIDPAFYKGTKDLQKRYKEIHAPGSKLDIDARWNGELIAGENPIERCVYFEDINVNGENTDTEFMNSILYNFAQVDDSEVEKAIAAGITTPKEGQEEADRISELKKLLGKNWDIYKSYQKNTLTDGQGYRTLQSYRKVMIMAGKWDPKMERVYNELLSIKANYKRDQEIPKDVLKKIASLAVIFMPIKPYMYTFENYALNNNEKALIPVQHKYAEAVLIPELLPKGSKLRDMAYWMEEHTEDGIDAPIDLICSTKAVKVGNFGATDISKVSSSSDLNTALGQAYVHQLSYSDYRIQTNVPEHINGSQLFGTQVRKLIMANVSMNSDYSRYTNGKVPRLYKNKDTKVNVLNGRNLIQFYNSLVVANILDSFDKFSEGVKDSSALSDALLQSTISNSRESIDNMLAYTLTGDGDFTIPLFEGGLEHDSAALIFSMFKKMVNKQKINGGSAVQVSAMGIKGYEEDGDLRYIVDPSNPKNIIYAETEIPFDLNYIDDNGQTVELQYDDWVNEDGTLKTDSNGTSLLELEFPGITNLIAYRIPTERDYSMINLKVKRFSRKEAGGTIKVPPQGTTISGFDFDIDKLYFMRRQYRRKSHYIQEGFSQSELYSIFAEIYENHPEIRKLLEDVRDASGEKGKPLNSYWDQMLEQNPSLIADPAYNKDNLFTEAVNSLVSRGELEVKEGRKEYSLDQYDYDKAPLDNSRIARNNMLIDLIQQRLQDPETFKQRYTPGGFKNASNAARVMRELLFGDLSTITSNGKIDYNKLYKRVEDSNLDPEPNYDPSDPLTIITYNQQNQVAGKLIGIFANQNTNHAFASLMSKMVIKPSSAFEFCGHKYSDFLHGPNGIDVDLNVAEFLAASVDAVKDPVLNFLNLNTLTADSGATLARLGYTTEEIGLLFNQPIIKDICEYSFNNNCNLDQAIREVKKGYENTAKVQSINADPSVDFTKDKLVRSIVEDRKRKEDNRVLGREEAIQQLKIADLFSKINTVSTDLSEFVTNTKFTASNAAGSTFGDYYAQQLKVKDYVDRFGKGSDAGGLSIDMQVSPSINIPINNGDSPFTMDRDSYMESLLGNPFAYEQAMFDMNRRALASLSKYYPYETSLYVKMRSRMNDLVRYGHLDAATINGLHNELVVFALCQQENSRFNGEGRFIYRDSNGNQVTTTNRKFYEEDFPEMVFTFTKDHPELKELPIFQYLETTYDENTKTVSLNIQNIGGLQPYQKDDIRDSWGELMKTYPGIATGLFMYNFYKLGFTFSPKAFMNIAPTEVKEQIKVGNISYTQFLKNLQDGKIGLDLERFAVQYMLNHTENSRFVKTLFGEDLKTVISVAKDEQGVFKSEFTLDVTYAGNDSKGFLISDPSIKEGEGFAFTPVLAIPDNNGGVDYYVADSIYSGNTGKFNVSPDKTMRYVYVKALGSTNNSLHYFGISENSRNTSAPVEPVTPGGRTDIIPEVSKEITDMTDEELIDELSENYAKALNKLGVRDDQNQPWSVSSLKAVYRAQLMGEGRESLENEIARIRKACRENGILVLNESGDLMFGC